MCVSQKIILRYDLTKHTCLSLQGEEDRPHGRKTNWLYRTMLNSEATIPRDSKTVPSYAHATLVSNVVLDVAKKSIKPVIMVRCRGIENLEILPTPEYTNNGVLLTLTIRDGLSRIPHYKESESELSPHHTVFLPSVL